MGSLSWHHWNTQTHAQLKSQLGSQFWSLSHVQPGRQQVGSRMEFWISGFSWVHPTSAVMWRWSSDKKKNSFKYIELEGAGFVAWPVTAAGMATPRLILQGQFKSLLFASCSTLASAPGTQQMPAQVVRSLLPHARPDAVLGPWLQPHPASAFVGF